MEARINNGKDSYLYCSVDCEVANYQDMYDSSEECFDDIKGDIIEDCKERGYNDNETQKVLAHYSITFSNSSVEWKNMY
jgi:hypothetical protein